MTVRVSFSVLALAVVVLATAANGVGGAAEIASYEAAGLQFDGTTGRASAPAASAADPAGVAPDGRIDAGRVLIDVPPGYTNVTLAVSDAAFAFVPLTAEGYRVNGPRRADVDACLGPGWTVTMPYPPDVNVLSIRVNAVDVFGLCPEGTDAGASSGVILASFS